MADYDVLILCNTAMRSISMQDLSYLHMQSYVIGTTVADIYETSTNLFNVHLATIMCTGTETHLANCSSEAGGSEDGTCTDNDVEDVAAAVCEIGKYTKVYQYIM